MEPPHRTAPVEAGTTGPPTAIRISATLRERITTGELAPGTRLKDSPLADEFGVSRNTLRDSLRQLEIDGLVISRRNAGYAVRMLTETDAHDIYQVRRTLEGAGVEATTRASAQELDGLSTCVTASRKAARGGQWSQVGTHSLRLHQAIVALLGSERFDSFFSNILAQLRLVFAVMDDEGTFQTQWIDRDDGLVKLLASGNRRQAHLELLQYLADSEAQIIDAIRVNGAKLQ